MTRREKVGRRTASMGGAGSAAGRMGRRAALARLGGLAALLAAPHVAAAADSLRDVLVVGQVAEPKSLDPHVVTALNDFRILANLYDGLVRYKADSLELEPALARAWEISDDGRVYTFRLREDVRFHDGAPFDADAVRFNLARMLDPEHPFHATGPFPLAFFFAPIRAIETPDRHTVRFVLDEPFAPLLSNLAYPTGFMVSPAAVRRHGDGFGRRPAGTGPFRFAAWESSVRVVLERNAEYWDGPPRLRAAVFRPLVDSNTRVTELLAGGIDLLVEPPPDVVPVLAADPRFAVHSRIGPHLWFLILNLKEGPFRDRRMRLAVNHAIDRRALVEGVLQGTAEIAVGPVPKAFGQAHDHSLAPYAFDPARARALVAEAGYAGAEITLYAPQGGSGMLSPVAMATAIQADLAKVGLAVRIETFEWNTYLSRVNRGLAGQADMAEMAWMTNDPGTLPYLALRRDAWPERGGFNSGYYASPEVDRLLAAARRETEPSARTRLLNRVQEIVHEDAPWVVVASWTQATVTRAGVRGFAAHPSFLLYLRDVEKR